MFWVEKLGAVDWSAVWREISDAIDRMPPDRDGMPDHSLDRLLTARQAARRSQSPTPAPMAPAPPPRAERGCLPHRSKNGSGVTPRTSGN
jgi:hypothetical protein